MADLLSTHRPSSLVLSYMFYHIRTSGSNDRIEKQGSGCDHTTIDAEIHGTGFQRMYQSSSDTTERDANVMTLVAYFRETTGRIMLIIL